MRLIKILMFCKSWRKCKSIFSGMQLLFYSMTKIIVFFHFIVSLLYTFYLASNTIVYTQSQGTSRQKYIHEYISKQKCGLCREINTSLSIFYLIGRVLSIFGQKMNGPNSSEIDMKVLIHFIYKHIKFYLIIGENLTFF